MTRSTAGKSKGRSGDMNLTFENPFSEYNAARIGSSKVLAYWCSPFRFAQLPSVSEANMLREPNPIVLMGGRGSGKTMVLRYFSYEVQKAEALRRRRSRDASSVLSHLKKRGGIGFYVRFDGTALVSFTGHGLDTDKWTAIFTHNFELEVCRSFCAVMLDLTSTHNLDAKRVNREFVPGLAKLLGVPAKQTPTLRDSLHAVERMIDEVTRFRTRVAFTETNFAPPVVFPGGGLSFGVPKLARDALDELKDISFVILLDEYENFLTDQQRVVNTLLKFVPQGISFRIGARLQGFHTHSTVSDDEFIMEGRDYTSFVFEDVLSKDRDYQEFLSNVVQKRLKAVPAFKITKLTNIKSILGETEDLEREARELVGGRDRHFDMLRLARLHQNIDQVKEALRYPANPLLEMLNILWVIRGRRPADVRKAMDDYLKGEHTADAGKYHMDYIDKYKLCLTFLLASIYRKNKQYYSFNTFCYLSSGIVGHFIELCRRSFQYAFFEDPDRLLKNGEISPDVQSRAAGDYAAAALREILKISRYGADIQRFARNLGNIFGEYHRDPLLRYVEPNQFAVDISLVQDPDCASAFLKALEWSTVQRKGRLQPATPGTERREIYALSRIFAPAFGFSYRTRGGYSESYDPRGFTELFKSERVAPRLSLGQRQTDEAQRQIEFPEES